MGGLWFPLRRVIGAAHDPELVTAAKTNLARWARSLRCRDVVLECVDARDFDVPDDVTVVYTSTRSWARCSLRSCSKSRSRWLAGPGR